MTVIREFLKVDNHKISYELPKGFDYDEVEVIIMPKNESVSKNLDDIEMFSNHSASLVEEWQVDIEDEIWKE